MTSPTATVAACVPVHRPAPGHLVALVASLLGQEVPCEVVLAHDAVDAPVVHEVLDALTGAAGHERVRPVQHGGGAGMVADWCAAVGAAEAPLVVVPGQDDLLRPAMLRRHLAEHADPEVVLVASGAALVDDEGRPAGPRRPRAHDRAAVLAGRSRRRLDRAASASVVLRNGTVIGAPSQVTFRRDAYEAVGGFSARYEHAADVDLWLRLAAHGDVLLLADPLATRRVHGGAATVAHRAGGAAARDRERLAEDHGHLLDAAAGGQAAAARARWSAADVVRAAARGDVAGARSHAAAAARVAPRAAAPWVHHAREVLTGRNVDA
jgi:hypothetical protein